MIGLVGLIMLPLLNSVWATTDLSTLASPNVSISPSSGPPGTQVTITVSNLPDISKESYPYPDLYIYLPFSQSFGSAVQSQCGGTDCFPIYTYSDAVNHDTAPRTITFTLFGTINPNPVYLNGLENSVCDVIVNGNTAERYSTLCNTKDQPAGTYDIKLGWAEENAPQINHIVQTIPFVVTQPLSSPPTQVADNGNSIIQAYQDGQITQAEFESKLAALGWNQEAIRQALATIGKLPQQLGAPVPEQMQQIQQGVQKAAAQANPQTTPPVTQVQTIQPVTQGQTTQPIAAQQVAPATQSSPVQTQQLPQQDTQQISWKMITILAAMAVAIAVGGSLLTIKMTRKVTN